MPRDLRKPGPVITKHLPGREPPGSKIKFPFAATINGDECIVWPDWIEWPEDPYEPDWEGEWEQEQLELDLEWEAGERARRLGEEAEL